MKPRLSANEEAFTSQPTHPYHRLYLKALRAVHDHEARTGNRSDGESETLAAALVMSIKEKDRSTAYHIKLSRDRQQVTYQTRRGLVPRTKKAEVNLERASSRGIEWDRGRCAEREDQPRDTSGEPVVLRSSASTVEPMAQADHPPICERAVPPSSARTVRLMANPGHRDHELYEQALDAVYLHDAEAERIPDDRSEKLAASLVMSAREGGLSAIHRMSWGPGDKTVRLEQHRWSARSKWALFFNWFPCFKKTVTVDVQQALDRRLEEDRPPHGAQEGSPLNSLRAVGMPEPSISFDPAMATAGHRDHELYQQALTKLMAVEALRSTYTDFPKDWIQRISAALVASSLGDGLNSIDRVAWGADKDTGLIKVFAVQDGFFPCWRKTTQVYLGDALLMSTEDVNQWCEEARELASPPPLQPRNHQVQQAHALVR